MNLSERFYQYLIDNQITEFTTREAFEWYRSYKQTPGPPDRSNLYGLVLNPLIHKELIKRVLYHSYILVARPDVLENFSQSNLIRISPETAMSEMTGRILKETTARPESVPEEDKEFFEYLNSKIKGGK